LLPLDNNNCNSGDDDDDDDENVDGDNHRKRENDYLNSNVATNMASSPLALVTRYGAPSFCIEAVLNAETRMVRRLIPNRGTPLHEAIMLYPTSGNTTTHFAASVSVATNNNNDNNTNMRNEEENYNRNNTEDKVKEYVKIVRMLINADEALEKQQIQKNEAKRKTKQSKKEYKSNCTNRPNRNRATLMQDIDGNVPLHLLVRQAFYNYLGGLDSFYHSSPSHLASSNNDENKNNNKKCPRDRKEHPIFTIAQELIKSSPEAVAIPDCTEFEETPLILALKGSVYANEQFAQQRRRSNSNSDIGGIDYYNATLVVERKIFDLCKVMLQSYPAAASRVMAQSGYTAVHSAVFHGRCSDTIRLLLNADETNRKRIACNSDTNGSDSYKMKVLPAAMQANKFGELPLHFATMRGECTRSIALLSQASPWAVLRRDVKIGLTPIHWLWIRFVDTMLERFGSKRFFENDDEDSIFGNETFDVVEENDEELEDEDEGEDESDTCDSHLKSEHKIQNPSPVFALANRSSFVLPMTSSTVPTCYTSSSATTNNTTTDTSNHTNHDNENDGNDHIHFDLEYHIRTEAIDPPVDYMRMRHVAPEYLKIEGVLMDRVIRVLRRVRERHKRFMEEVIQIDTTKKNGRRNNNNDDEMDDDHHHAKEGLCPMSSSRGTSSQSHKQLSKQGRSFVDSVTSPNKSDNFNEEKIQCPFSHLKTKSISQAKCPYANSTTVENSGKHLMKNEDSLNKKCPFRCPFVFDSYPVDASIMGSAKEEAVREEQLISLFWAKVTSLLNAAALANLLDIDQVSLGDLNFMNESIDYESTYMLHTACSSPCPSSVVKLCLGLHPEQLMEQDSSGKVALHHAASRAWDPRELSLYVNESVNNEFVEFGANNFPPISIERQQNNNAEIDSPNASEHDLNNNNLTTTRKSKSNLIENESANVLKLLVSASPPEAAQITDSENRLPLHHLIDTVVKGAVRYQMTRGIQSNIKGNVQVDGMEKEQYNSIIDPLKCMIRIYPDALEYIDGRTLLHPFMQASAIAAESFSRFDEMKCSENISLSLVFTLLLENPSTVTFLL